MGVLECSRKDCDGILCNYYVEGYGYICNDCRNELIETSPKSVEDVILFLNTSKIPKYTNEDGEFCLDKLITIANNT